MNAEAGKQYVAIGHFTSLIDPERTYCVYTTPFKLGNGDDINSERHDLAELAGFRLRLANGFEPIAGLFKVEVYELSAAPVLTIPPTVRA